MRGIEYLSLIIAVLLLTLIAIGLLLGKTRSAGVRLKAGLSEYKESLGIKTTEIIKKEREKEDYSLIIYAMGSLWAGAMLWSANKIFKATR